MGDSVLPLLPPSHAKVKAVDQPPAVGAFDNNAKSKAAEPVRFAVAKLAKPRAEETTKVVKKEKLVKKQMEDKKKFMKPVPHMDAEHAEVASAEAEVASAKAKLASAKETT